MLKVLPLLLMPGLPPSPAAQLKCPAGRAELVLTPLCPADSVLIWLNGEEILFPLSIYKWKGTMKDPS